MKHNLLLVAPPPYDFGEKTMSNMSLALLYLAGAARDAKVCDDIKVFDFNAPSPGGKTIEQFFEVCPDEGIVGINCLFSAIFPAVRKIAQEIRLRKPNVKIVSGGMHPSFFAKDIMENCTEFDAIAIGESDNNFPHLLRYLWGECGIDELESVAVRNSDGSTLLIPRKGYIQNLDNIPFPGYEYFNFNDYRRDTSNWWSPDGIKISSGYVYLLTSRSCPNRCNFCSMWQIMGTRFRMRSAESIFNEIQFLNNTYQINYFQIMDDSFTFNRQRVIDICEKIIFSGMKVYFTCPNGISVKTIDRELIQIMRKAGFIEMSIAVESGSDYIRNKIMGKGTSKEQIYNAYKWCKEFGIKTRMFLIVGMPEETEETIQETRKLIEEIDTDYYAVSSAIPLPGTKLYEQCVKDGLLFEKSVIDWTGDSKMVMGNGSQISKFAHLQADETVREIHLKPYALTVERMMELKKSLVDFITEKSIKL